MKQLNQINLWISISFKKFDFFLLHLKFQIEFLTHNFVKISKSEIFTHVCVKFKELKN